MAGWRRSKGAAGAGRPWLLEVQVDLVDRGRRPGVAFDGGELAVDDGEPVVAAGVEVGELVDPVQDVADELLQEHPGGDADAAAEVAGDRLREEREVVVVARRADAVRVVG